MVRGVTENRKRKIYLHIGTEKTGTSYLQSFLSQNNLALNDQGFCYPSNQKLKYFYNKGHFPLVGCLLETQIDFLSPEKIFADNEVYDSLKDDIKNSADNVILSAEHFSSRIKDKASLKKIKNLLADFHIYVVIYFRPEYEIINSSYYTGVQGGRSDPLDIGNLKAEDHLLDYDFIINLWGSIFGYENLIVRDYKNLVNNNLAYDFLNILGISDKIKFTLPDIQNKSKSIYHTEILRRMNNFMPKYGELSNQDWQSIINWRILIENYLDRIKIEGNNQNLTLNEQIIIHEKYRKINCSIVKFIGNEGLENWAPKIQKDRQYEQVNEDYLLDIMVRLAVNLSFDLSLQNKIIDTEFTFVDSRLILINELKEKLNYLGYENKRLSDELSDVYNSFSWNITTGIRELNKRIKRLRLNYRKIHEN